MQLRFVALRRGTALKVGHIGPFVGDDQRAFKLTGVFSVDAEISGQFHRTAHTRRHVNERPVGKHGRIQRRIEIVIHWHNRTKVLFHQFRMVADRLRDGTKDHPRRFQFFLKSCADGYRIEDRIHSNLARRIGQFLGTLDTGQQCLLFQRDTQLFIGGQQLWVDVVQRLRLDRHRFWACIIILALKVDLWIVDHRPVRFLLGQPALIGRKTPFQHPFRLFVLTRDQLDDIFVQTQRGVIHLDISGPAMLVGTADFAHRIYCLLIDAVFYYRSVHAHIPLASGFTPPASGVSSIFRSMHRQSAIHRLFSSQDQAIRGSRLTLRPRNIPSPSRPCLP